MKKIALSLIITLASALAVFAGETYSGKESKAVVPPPCPEWYGDTEWNVSIWGTYLFTGNDWEEDEYLQTDHAWGGGLDAKYFFHRYFGVGLEGWVVGARRDFFDISGAVGAGGPPLVVDFGHETRAIGAVKGTFTIRVPLHCSRFAPYIWGGGGVIFGGGETDELIIVDTDPTVFDTVHSDGDAEWIAQIGAGFEVRLTRHIGIINDFSWNFVGRDNSDFGMIRSGLNFAF